jgi:hypothetical protein
MQTTTPSNPSDLPEQNTQFDLGILAKAWPSPVVARDQTQLDRFSGGILNARTLANLDCLGVGPPGRLKIGRKVCYPVLSLIKWMKSRQEVTK